ncbi:MAG: ATPase [Ruminococcus sp.]|nr:ATPase [Ruminococcus sp.]
MAIEKLETVNILCYRENIDDVLERCYNSECFHIEQPEKNENNALVVPNEENPYIALSERLNAFYSKMGYDPREVDCEDFEANDPESIGRCIEELGDEIRNIKDRIDELNEEITLRRQVEAQLKHLDGIDADYQKLFMCDNVRVRFGRLPISSYYKLSYHEHEPFIFNIYDDDGEYYWGMYFTTKENKDLVDGTFRSLYFERIHLPDFVQGTGKDAAAKNSEELAVATTERDKLEKELHAFVESREEYLDKLYSKLRKLDIAFELRRYAGYYNEKYVAISGYVPKKKSKAFKELFSDLDTVSVMTAPVDEHSTPPTLLKNNKFAEPFSMFVEMYGLPSGKGYDPTMLVAVTYTLLFGLMFADLGQGLVISIAGMLIWKLTKNKLGAILARVGIASAVFGFIFGSVFGFEELLNPVFYAMGFEEKPFEVMHSINTVLYGAIAIGIFFIIMTIIVNICIGLKQKDYERALFSNNGLAGLVFFVAVVGALVGGILLKLDFITPAYIICLIVIPALLMFFREPLGAILAHKRLEKVSLGDYIASNFFEVFEFALSFATNTLSFVRVGGFILSHAGMMSVVMLLAESAGSEAARMVVIVIGNIFVIGMEGLIVGIQSLRLEFYEIFSRFYDGDGYPFVPVNMRSELATKK